MKGLTAESCLIRDLEKKIQAVRVLPFQSVRIRVFLIVLLRLFFSQYYTSVSVLLSSAEAVI